MSELRASEEGDHAEVTEGECHGHGVGGRERSPQEGQSTIRSLAAPRMARSSESRPYRSPAVFIAGAMKRYAKGRAPSALTRGRSA